jgi:hypothetical protein
MLVYRNWNEAVKGRVLRETPHQRGTRVQLLGTSTPGAHPQPQAYVVEQAPGWVLRQHYHSAHQFQVVSDGSGFIGRTAVAPVVVHYASPETGYGPITAGPQGLSYHTLRPCHDEQTRYLPESRELMRAGLAKHHGMTAVVEPLPGPLLRSDALRVEELMQATADGARVWRVCLPAGTGFAAEALRASGPRYYYLMAGQLLMGDEALGARSVCFSRDEPNLVLRAGADGVDLLVLQFPAHAGLMS